MPLTPSAQIATYIRQARNPVEFINYLFINLNTAD